MISSGLSNLCRAVARASVVCVAKELAHAGEDHYSAWRRLLATTPGALDGAHAGATLKRGWVRRALVPTASGGFGSAWLFARPAAPRAAREWSAARAALASSGVGVIDGFGGVDLALDLHEAAYRTYVTNQEAFEVGGGADDAQRLQLAPNDQRLPRLGACSSSMRSFTPASAEMVCSACSSAHRH